MSVISFGFERNLSNPLNSIKGIKARSGMPINLMNLLLGRSEWELLKIKEQCYSTVYYDYQHFMHNYLFNLGYVNNHEKSFLDHSFHIWRDRKNVFYFHKNERWNSLSNWNVCTFAFLQDIGKDAMTNWSKFMGQTDLKQNLIQFTSVVWNICTDG